jgi:hypothetical protein
MCGKYKILRILFRGNMYSRFFPRTYMRGGAFIISILVLPIFMLHTASIFLEKTTGFNKFISNHVTSKSMVLMVSVAHAALVYLLFKLMPKIVNETTLSFIITGSSSPRAWKSFCYFLLAGVGGVALYTTLLLDVHRNDVSVSESYPFSLRTMVAASIFVGIGTGIILQISLQK